MAQIEIINETINDTINETINETTQTDSFNSTKQGHPKKYTDKEQATVATRQKRKNARIRYKQNETDYKLNKNIVKGDVSKGTCGALYEIPPGRKEMPLCGPKATVNYSFKKIMLNVMRKRRKKYFRDLNNDIENCI
ncbi:MAG: hypothetical protein EZS28_027313 [Streblomastix strix]|uniref:Uncharacterized protein n=1 Tax=Streblomastix strix TaxID=222440 RepID=A0A5J4V456_9EUKA|nr:MAG: hypothetical protein EZS28_027313 [Streblomastix strix]